MGKKKIGLLFEKYVSYSSAERAKLLSSIQNPLVHRALRLAGMNDEVQAITKATFIPWYVRPDNQAFELLISTCEEMLGLQDNRHVFIQGKLPIAIGSRELIKLAQLGFNEIIYPDSEGKRILKKLIKDAHGKKKLIVFHTHIEEKDYRLFINLADTFIGVAGDDTLADAISRRIPFRFTPANQDKRKAMRKLLETVNADISAGKIDPLHPVIVNFLSPYSEIGEYEEFFIENSPSAVKSLLAKENKLGEAIYDSRLLTVHKKEWEEFCEYLTENYNAYDSLSDIFNAYKKQLKLDKAKETDFLESESAITLRPF